jgi:hypothetical protein
MFKLIKVRAAKVKTAPKKGAYIIANGRQYIESLDDHSDLDTGITNYFSKDKTKVKRVQNYI